MTSQHNGNATCSIIIVNWNAAGVIGKCLESIRRQDYEPSPEVIIWDNASADDSLQVIADSRTEVNVVESEENLGFARANNAASRIASGEFLLFLNPDAFLEGDECLSRLIGVMTNDVRIGLVGPMLLNTDGSVQKSVGPFPSIKLILILGLGLHRVMPDRMKAALTPTQWSQAWTRKVDWLKGAAMLVRASDFTRIGRMSEATFMYAEDVELAYRIAQDGKDVIYFADAKVTHVDDYSSSKRWTDAEKERLVVQAEGAFMQQHYGPLQIAAIRTLKMIFVGVRIVVLTLLGRKARARVYRQVFAGLRGS